MVNRIKLTIRKSLLKTCFAAWRAQVNGEHEEEHLLPKVHQQALAYFQNWKSFNASSPSKSAAYALATWRGKLKEQRLLNIYKRKMCLPVGNRAPLSLLKAFDKWREAVDYAKRRSLENHKLEEKYFSLLKSLHLRHKARGKTAGLIGLMALYKKHFTKWKACHEHQKNMDKLGLIAWYQKMVGDNFIQWRKAAGEKRAVRKVFTSWRAKIQVAKSSFLMASQYNSESVKTRAFRVIVKIAKAASSRYERANAFLERSLHQKAKNVFASWRASSEDRQRHLQLASNMYNNQVKRNTIKRWGQTSSLQRIADEHLKGQVLVKALFRWRASVQEKQEKMSTWRLFMQKWLNQTRVRRSTRYFFGQAMLRSISKYGPSTSALSVLLPSPELSSTQTLSRHQFDAARDKARCTFLWLNKTRKSIALRLAAIDYKKTIFAKNVHKWRSLLLLHRNYRNEPRNLLQQFMFKWRMSLRNCSSVLSKCEKRVQVLVVLCPVQLTTQKLIIGIHGKQKFHAHLSLIQALGTRLSDP